MQRSRNLGTLSLSSCLAPGPILNTNVMPSPSCRYSHCGEVGSLRRLSELTSSYESMLLLLVLLLSMLLPVGSVQGSLLMTSETFGLRGMTESDCCAGRRSRSHSH